MNKSSKKYSTFKYMWTVFVAVVAVVISSIAISGAWFSDSIHKSNSNINNFGTVSIRIDNKTSENNSFLFDAQELVPGEPSPTRTLQITNTGTVSCYVRFKLTISINGNVNQSLITLNPTVSNWVKSGDYYIYGSAANTPTAVAATTNNTASAALTFNVSSNFGNANAGQTVAIHVMADAVQCDNNTGTINWA